MATIRLRGIQESQSDLVTGPIKIDTSSIPVQAKGRVRLGLARDFGGIVDLGDMQSDDIACVEYSNGFKLWMRVDDLYAEHGKPNLRGSGVDPNIWALDFHVHAQRDVVVAFTGRGFVDAKLGDSRRIIGF